MDIEAYIEKNAPNDDVHDKAYAAALRGAYDTYKDMPLHELRQWQDVARSRYDSTHNSTAACMVLYELIAEKCAADIKHSEAEDVVIKQSKITRKNDR